MPLFEQRFSISYPDVTVAWDDPPRLYLNKEVGAEGEVTRIDYLTPSASVQRSHCYTGSKGEERCCMIVEHGCECETVCYRMDGPAGEERIITSHTCGGEVTFYEGLQGHEAIRRVELPDDKGVEFWKGERGKEYLVNHVKVNRESDTIVTTFYSTNVFDFGSLWYRHVAQMSTGKIKFFYTFEGIGDDVRVARIEDTLGFLSYVKNDKVYKVVDKQGIGIQTKSLSRNFDISAKGKLLIHVPHGTVQYGDYYLVANALSLLELHSMTITYLLVQHVAEHMVPSVRMLTKNIKKQVKILRLTCKSCRISYQDVKEMVETLRIQEDARRRRDRALELMEAWRKHTWTLIIERRHRIPRLMDAWRRETQRIILSRRARSPYGSLSWSVFRKRFSEERESARMTEQHVEESRRRAERRRLAAEARKKRLEQLEATTSVRDACRQLLLSSSLPSSSSSSSPQPGVTLPGVIGKPLSKSDRLLRDHARQTSKSESIERVKKFEHEKFEAAKKQCELAEQREEQIRIGDRILHGK